METNPSVDCLMQANSKWVLQDQLGEDSEDFQGLECLVENSDGIISWEKLEAYTKIENDMIEGIYWKGNLDLIGSGIDDLRKIKRVDGFLSIAVCSCLESLGELEYANFVNIGDSPREIQLELIQRIVEERFTSNEDCLFSGPVDNYKGALLKCSSKELEKLKYTGNFSKALNKICSKKMKKNLGKESEDFLYLEQFLGIVLSMTLFEALEIEDGKIKGLSFKKGFNLGKKEKFDPSKIDYVSNLEVSDASLEVQLGVMIKNALYGTLETPLPIEYDLGRFYNEDPIHHIYEELLKLKPNRDFSIKDWDDFQMIYDFLGKPEDREGEILEAMNYIGKALIEYYLESVESHMIEIKDLNQNAIQEFMDDRSEKEYFFKKVFGEKLVEEILK